VTSSLWVGNMTNIRPNHFYLEKWPVVYSS
jgi:hypothetical protein